MRRQFIAPFWLNLHSGRHDKLSAPKALHSFWPALASFDAMEFTRRKALHFDAPAGQNRQKPRMANIRRSRCPGPETI
jgi:hypothetical protein